MNTSIQFAVAAIVLWAGTLTARDDAKAEMKKLEGTWVGVSAVADGKDVAADKAKSLSLTMKTDGTWTMTDGKETWHGTFTVDATKSPKTARFAILSGKNKDHTTLDIYEVDGDTFKCCYAIVPTDKASDKDRPTKFAAEAGSGHILSIMKREKAEVRAGPIGSLHLESRSALVGPSVVGPRLPPEGPRSRRGN